MRRLFSVLVAVISTSTAGAEINLTPSASFRELEGCKFPQVEFRDDERTILYEPPPQWRALGRDRHTLALVPPQDDMVSAKIKFLPTTGTLVLDEAQLKYFKETASQLLPPESKITGEPKITPNPLRLDGYTTCELDIVFVMHAQRFRMSVLFVDLGQSQLRFSLISRAAEFEALHSAFQASLYTWQWLGTKERSL